MNRGIIRKVPTEKQLDITIEAGIHNRFDIIVQDAKTGTVKQKAQAFNVICDNLWNGFTNYSSSSTLYAGYSYFAYIAYGNGTGTPSSSDTNLFGTAYYGSPSTVETVIDAEHGVAWRTRSITLSETTSVGVTIREVGLARNNSSGNLCTHAMLQDMNGNPISIYKSSTDIITIYATVYVHWNPSGYNGVHIANTCQATTRGPCNFLGCALGSGFTMGYGVQYSGTYYSGLVKCGLGTAVTTAASSTAPTVTWTQSTKTIRIKLARIPVGSGNNDGGFGWLRIANCYSSSPYEFAVIDVRGEYEVSGEAVGTGDGETTEFKTKFDLPYNAKVLVDGIEATDVTVLKIPRNTNAYNYFLQVEEFLYEGNIVHRCDNDAWRGTFFNPLWEIGLQSFSGSSYYRFSFSDDMVTWSDAISQGTIPEEYRHCKYIKITSTSTSTSISAPTISFSTGMSGNNIIFSNPPANGSVITIDYNTPFVPKDTNHVYDLTFSVQFGEYTD